MRCPGCSAQNPDGHLFCDSCGAALTSTCPSCGVAARPGARFCGRCGASLDSASTSAAAESAATSPANAPKPLVDTVLAARSAIEGERRRVTVLFADLADLNDLSARCDADELRLIANHCFGLVTDAVHGLDGTIGQYTGDGVMALFGAPRAQEDGPRRAVQAALDIQRALVDYSRALEAERGLRATMRIGLHTGVVVVGRIGDELRMDYTAMGDTTALAARLQQAAAPGHVLISAATQDLVKDQFDTIDLGHLQVTGHQSPIRAYEVTGAPMRAARRAAGAETPYVGRERELGTLVDLLARATAGQGQVAFISGVAGIGKSRLIAELRGRAPAAASLGWLEGAGVPWGQAIPLLPVIDQLRTHFTIDELDDEPAVVAKLDAGLAQLGGLTEHAPWLRYALGVDPGDIDVPLLEPPVRRARTFDALRTWIGRVARQRPTVLVFEDLHWIDRSTEEYLATLIDLVADLPVVVLATYRTGYTPPFDSRTTCTTVALQPLSEPDTLALASGVLGAADVPDALRAILLSKADGVPLFIEEMSRAWLDRDASDTVEGAIMARVDRLGDSGKRAVQLAAVIGSHFLSRLLVRAAVRPSRLDGLLGELTRIGRADDPTGSIHTFEHAVIQDVAYRSLPPRRRTDLHRSVGLAIEALYADRVAEHCGALAYHFARAEQWDKVWEYARRAGNQAADASANREAAAHYARALEAAEHVAPPPDPALLVDLHVGYAAVLDAVGEPRDGIAHYERALALARETNDRRATFDVLLGLADLYYEAHAAEEAQSRCDEALAIAAALDDAAAQAACLARRATYITAWQGPIAEARRTARAAVALVERLPSASLRARPIVSLGAILQWRGDLDGCLPLLQDGAGLAQEAHIGGLLGEALYQLGQTHRCGGRYEQALRWYGELRMYVEQANDAFWAVRVASAIGAVHLDLYDPTPCIESCRAGDELAQRLSPWPEPRGQCLVAMALAHLQRGEGGAADAALRRAEELLEADAWARWRWHIPLLRARAELALLVGETDDAWRWASQSLDLATQTDARIHVARAKFLLGEIAAAQDRLPEAEKLLRSALSLAEHLRAAAELWLAASALARILERTGRDQEAETPLTLAAQTIEAIAVELVDPTLRASFADAEAVADVYRRLRRRPRPMHA